MDAMSFEDLEYKDDKFLQETLKNVPDKLLVQALQKASVNLVTKILGNISPRRAEIISEEINLLPELSERAIKTARKNVMKYILNLLEQKEVDSSVVSDKFAQTRKSTQDSTLKEFVNDKNQESSTKKVGGVKKEEFMSYFKRLYFKNPVVKSSKEKRKIDLISELIKRFTKKNFKD